MSDQGTDSGGNESHSVGRTGEPAGVEEVLADYLLAAEAGQAPDREAFIRLHPQFAKELREFFADEARVGSLAGLAWTAAPVDATKDSDLTVGSDPATAGSGSGRPLVRYFGEYELLEEIGRGGMGVVYKARQLRLNRPVALKMILAGRFAGSEEVKRFQVEAENAARLDHPYIVPVYEVGRHRGQHYFSMKLIEGGSLSRHIDRFTNDHRLAAQLIATVARAVHHAHQHGILHRDLKPGNILIDGHDQPQVTDFGLARRIEAEAGLTLSGAVLGSPRYMAPEQARGEKGLTVAADVYSLGAVLYELLTGRPPFGADTVLETLRQVREQEPPRPSSVIARMDRDLETVCLKCLEKDPRRRYSSALALAEDLERWLAGEPIFARPSNPWHRSVKWARRKPAVAALLAALMFGLLGTTTGLVRARVAERAALERKVQVERLLADVSSARNEAQRESIRAKAVGDFLQRMITSTRTEPVPHADNVSLHDLLNRASSAVEEQFRGQPEAEIQARLVLAMGYESLAAYDRARRHLERANALASQYSAEETEVGLRAAAKLAMAYHMGGGGDALAIARPAFVRAKRVLGDDAEVTIHVQTALGMALRDTDPAEADAVLTDLVHRMRRTADPLKLSSIPASALAGLRIRQGNLRDAETLLKESLEVAERSDTSNEVAFQRLAGLFVRQGRTAEAVELYERLLTAQNSRLSDSHQDLIQTRQDYIPVLQRAGNDARVRELHEEQLAAIRKRIILPVSDAVGLAVRAECHARLGDFAKAAADFDASLAGDPNNHWPWFVRGCLFLFLKDPDGYNCHRAEMMNRFGDSTVPFIADRTAKTCMLLPTADAEQVTACQRLIDRALPIQTDAFIRAYFRLTKGMVDFRAGNYEAAIQWLDTGRGGFPDHFVAAIATADLLLAMAQYQLGRHQESLAMLRRVRGTASARLPKPGIEDLGIAGVGVENWLIYHIVLREAEQLIESKEPALQHINEFDAPQQ